MVAIWFWLARDGSTQFGLQNRDKQVKKLIICDMLQRATQLIGSTKKFAQDKSISHTCCQQHDRFQIWIFFHFHCILSIFFEQHFIITKGTLDVLHELGVWNVAVQEEEFGLLMEEGEREMSASERQGKMGRGEASDCTYLSCRYKTSLPLYLHVVLYSRSLWVEFPRDYQLLALCTVDFGYC